MCKSRGFVDIAGNVEKLEYLPIRGQTQCPASDSEALQGSGAARCGAAGKGRQQQTERMTLDRGAVGVRVYVMWDFAVLGIPPDPSTQSQFDSIEIADLSRSST